MIEAVANEVLALEMPTSTEKLQELTTEIDPQPEHRGHPRRRDAAAARQGRQVDTPPGAAR